MRIWEGTSLHLSHKMMGKNKTIEDRSAVARIAFGKRWCTSWINEEICKACEEAPRSIRHTLMQCGNERMREGRKMWTDEVYKGISKIRDVDLKGAVSELWSRMKTGSGGEYAMYGCFQPRMVDGLHKGNMFLKDGEETTVMSVLKKIGEGARMMTNLYMDSRMGEDVKKELRQANIFGYYGKKGGKGADAPFNTVIKKVNRNTISKNKKKRIDLEEPKRVGGWIEVDGRLWEWKPP